VLGAKKDIIKKIGAWFSISKMFNMIKLKMAENLKNSLNLREFFLLMWQFNITI